MDSLGAEQEQLMVVSGHRVVTGLPPRVSHGFADVASSGQRLVEAGAVGQLHVGKVQNLEVKIKQKMKTINELKNKFIEFKKKGI